MNGYDPATGDGIFEMDGNAVNIESWEVWEASEGITEPYEQCTDGTDISLPGFKAYQDWDDYNDNPPDTSEPNYIGFIILEGEIWFVPGSPNGIMFYPGNIPNNSAYCLVVRVRVSDDADIGSNQNVDAGGYPPPFGGDQACYTVYLDLNGQPVFPAEQCNIPIITIEPPVDSWMQTTGGDVGVHGGITMDREPYNPAISGDNAAYLVLANGLVTNFRSAKGWLVHRGTSGDYLVDLHGLDSYDKFLEKFGPEEATVTYSDLTEGHITGPLGGDGGVLLWDSPMVTTTSNINYECAVCDPAVIFITGDMIIDKWIKTDSDTGLVFIVKGNITIVPTVEEVGAILISENQISSPYSSKQLKVNGSAYAFGGFTLARDFRNNPCTGLCNKNNPAEQFIYEPKYLWLFRQLLGTSETIFEELAP